MAINKVIYGADTLVDLTEDTVTAEDVLNSKSFHTPDGVQRTGTASYPVTDVQVNGESVLDGTVAKVEQPTADKKTATDQFTTANGGLLSKCMIDLVPVQDLHGYSNPWVGGAGKNKFDGNYAYHSTNALTPVVEGQTYAISLKHESGGEGCNYSLYDGSTFSQDTLLVGTGSTATYIENSVTIPQGVTAINIYTPQTGTNSNNDISELQIELGSQATSYEPYSNICPISGHTEVDLYNVGKNKLPLVLANIKSLNTSGTWSGNAYTQNGGTFTVLTDSASNIVGVNVNGTFSTATRFYLYRSAVEAGSYIINGGISDDLAFGLRGDSSLIYSTGSDKAYTISADKADAEANIVASNKTFNNVVRPMLRLSTETDSTFEPYLGHLYQVQIGSIVYGGYVDLVSGVMVADRFYFSLNGTENFTLSQASASNPRRFSLNITSAFSAPIIKSGLVSELSSHFKLATSAPTNPWGVFRLSISGSNMLLVLPDANSVFASDTDVENYFATQYANGTPAQFSYEMETPFTIQLTPQQIEALVGENNLSCPLDGQSIQTNGVEYREVFAFDDVEKVVSLRVPISMLGTDESGNTNASRAYTTGEFFYKDGKMYKVLTNIASGATFTVGTNISETTLFAELTALA